MTGWEKVIAATLVVVVGLAALNLSIWRRLKAASAEAKRQAGLERD